MIELSQVQSTKKDKKTLRSIKITMSIFEIKTNNVL